MTFPNPFPVARYRFDCRVTSPIHLPEYAGSTLRGAFGNALRRTACMTRQKECKPCPLYRSCPYPAVFAPPPPASHALQQFSDIPAGFIVEPPDWGEKHYEVGDTLSFHFVAIGQAIHQLPLIIHAWQRALEKGIGRGEGTATLQSVALTTDVVAPPAIMFDAECGQVAPHSARLTLPNTYANDTRLQLHLSTPMRIQRNSHPLGPEELESRDLLVGLIRRISLISEFHAGNRLELDYGHLAEQARSVTSEKELTWLDWKRYSSRQNQEMVLGGVVGRWALSGELDPFRPFLYLGQWLHVGKNASFGLGRYQLAP
jgi:hypothetical protein